MKTIRHENFLVVSINTIQITSNYNIFGKIPKTALDDDNFSDKIHGFLLSSGKQKSLAGCRRHQLLLY